MSTNRGIELRIDIDSHRCHDCPSRQAHEATILNLYEPAILAAARRLNLYAGQDAHFAARVILGQLPTEPA